MFNHYGTPITYILQKRCMYTIPNHGQVNRCFNEEAFYEYELVDSTKVHTGIRFVLNVEQADAFAKLNGLERYPNDKNY